MEAPTIEQGAYHGDAAFKDRFLGELRWHREQDAFWQGSYGWLLTRDKWRGCALACGLRSLDRMEGVDTRKRDAFAYSDHGELARRLEIPRVLAHLEDLLFESVYPTCAVEFPLRFATAIRPGADLSLVWPRLAHWMLVDPDAGVLRRASNELAHAVIMSVAALFERQIKGEIISKDEWHIATAEALALATPSAMAAAQCAMAAQLEALEMWKSMMSAIQRAMAMAAHYERIADKLIELLEAA